MAIIELRSLALPAAGLLHPGAVGKFGAVVHCDTLEQLAEVLSVMPTLRPGDVVVMDNLRTHHIQAVGELLYTAGADVLYLPPYSQDLNPIEKL